MGILWPEREAGTRGQRWGRMRKCSSWEASLLSAPEPYPCVQASVLLQSCRGLW